MKLRNKKTGEIVEAESCNSYTGTIGIFFEKGRETDRAYNSLAELNEEWEDVADTNVTKNEPVIKDEKIRKAVRAWAEANGRDLFAVINDHFNCCKIIGYTDGGNASCDKIEFSTTIVGAKKKYYTLAELCGEEE